MNYIKCYSNPVNNLFRGTALRAVGKGGYGGNAPVTPLSRRKRNIRTPEKIVTITPGNPDKHTDKSETDDC